MKTILFVMTVLSLAAVGCGTPKTPAELEAGLQSPDPVERRKSADGLRGGGEVPPESITMLLAAADKEDDPEALGAELITLGVSGVPDAKPRICKKFGDGDVRMSRWANHAIMAWLKKNPSQSGCTGVSTVQQVPANGAAPASTAPPAQGNPGGGSTTSSSTSRSI